MAKRQGKAKKPSQSTEIPFTPDVFQTTSNEPMPIEPPDTSSLTAMPELFPPVVIADDIDWRQHPRWKPLISTPSRLTPIPKGTLVPDPSPAHTFSDVETSTLMEPSPAGSFIHRRRQGEYVKRPPVWGLTGLDGDNSSHLPEPKSPEFDITDHDEDLPFPLKWPTASRADERHVKKDSLTNSDIKLPSYSYEDQLNLMATVFTTDPYIVNMAQDVTHMNFNTLEERIGRASPRPAIAEWIEKTPPKIPNAVLPAISDRDRSVLGRLENGVSCDRTDTRLPSVEVAIHPNSAGQEPSMDGPPPDSNAVGSGNRSSTHNESPADSTYSSQNGSLAHCLDIRTPLSIQGDRQCVYYIAAGSRVTCVDATSIAGVSYIDEHFELNMGDQYLVSKIFADKWALCVKCDLDKGLEIYNHGKSKNSIRKQIKQTLTRRSKLRMPATDPPMEVVEYDPKIINFLPLCAVTLDGNFGAYLRKSGVISRSTTSFSSPRAEDRESQRSPTEGGIVQAPERDSSKEEAARIRDVGHVEVPVGIYIASQLRPHKGPYATVRTISNGTTREAAPQQHPDRWGTVKKQPFKSIGRYIGKKSVRGRKVLQDAAQHLLRDKSYGNLLKLSGDASEPCPGAQALQTEDATTSDPVGIATPDDLSPQAPTDFSPQATDSAWDCSGESREPLLPSHNVATTTPIVFDDGVTDSVQQPFTTQSSISLGELLQRPSGLAAAVSAPDPRGSFILGSAAIVGLRTIARACNTPPPDDVIQDGPATEVRAPPDNEQTSAATDPDETPASIAVLEEPSTETVAASSGDQLGPTFEHRETIEPPPSPQASGRSGSTSRPGAPRKSSNLRTVVNTSAE